MKFGQLIKFNKKNIFRKKWRRETSSRLLILFYKKALYEAKAIPLSLVSIHFDRAALGYWSRDMLNFDFSEKGLGLVSPTHFVYDFSRKLFPTLYSINWPNFIVWLLLLLEILGNMCIGIVCFPGCNVMKFETKLIFLIKPFFYMNKKSALKFNYLENEKSL